MVDRGRLEELTRREPDRFAAAHPESRKLSEQAQRSLGEVLTADAYTRMTPGGPVLRGG
jgi:hypothetical protein